MAGITDTGEMRRIFPIPIRFYLKNIDSFKQFHWIKYDRKGKGDYRKESYKIDYKKIDLIKSATIEEVFELINSRINSIENLTELRNEENISLGFIKPKITKITLERPKNRIEKKRELSLQLTLINGTLGDYYVPFFVKFDFTCMNSSNCSGHSIICEDINLWSFLKEELEKNKSFQSIEEKFNAKFLKRLFNDEDLIFMMGTHYLYKTWMVISIISPSILKKLN